MNGVLRAMTEINDVDEQPDGRLVYTGWGDGLPVCRTERDGTPDETFGTAGGCVSVETSDARFGGEVLLDDEGRILVVGVGSPNAIVVARLTNAGVIDPTFANDGIAIVPLPHQPWSRQLFQHLGETFVAGYMHTPSGYRSFLLRLDATGAFDASFGNEGLLIGAWEEIVLLAGRRFAAVGDRTVSMFALDGSPDTSFGTNGFASVPLTEATTIASDCEGDLLVSGSGMAVVRISSDGDLKNVYPSLPDLWGRDFFADDIAAFSDGTIVIAGGLSSPDGGEGVALAISRRLSDGTPDPTFGTNGAIVFEESGGWANDLEVLDDGRYLVSGTWNQANGLIVRFWN